LAEACFRFSPQLAVREIREGDSDYSVFIEIGGCQRLYSEELLKLKLSMLAKRFGWLSRVTFGESAGEAFALARNPGFPYFEDLPLEALVDFMTPFGLDPDGDYLEKKISQLVETLKILGLKNVREFASLPPRTLSSRFGKEAVELSGCIRDQFEMPWPGFHPSSKVIEKAPVENSESLEALSFVLKMLVDRAVARLHGRCERASVVQLDFELVRWGRRPEGRDAKVFLRSFKLELPIPQGSTRGLLPILQEYLSARLQREPLVAPVDSIQLQILETVPSRGSQRDFFSRKEEEAEIWDALVSRLSLKIGVGNVYTAVPVNRYLPEKAYRRSLKKLSPDEYVGAAWPERPTRVLRVPQPLLPHPESEEKWKVAEVKGPERISSEWWNSQYEGIFRDYYRVKTVTGEELWVFRNRKSSEPVLYLHGYFD
jgi:protein ImuB